jgi:hypothetical protein
MLVSEFPHSSEDDIAIFVMAEVEVDVETDRETEDFDISVSNGCLHKSFL